jgi:hypothetical protein
MDNERESFGGGDVEELDDRLEGVGDDRDDAGWH